MTTENCAAFGAPIFIQTGRSRVGRPIIPNPLQFLFPELNGVSTAVLPQFPSDIEES